MELIGYRRLSLKDLNIAKDASDEEVRKAKRLGFAVQKSQITQWASANNHVIVEWLDDEASGKNMNREGLQTALQMLRAGQADGLVVNKLARVSRSVPDFGSLLQRAKRQGWNFIAIDLGVDTSTPIGKLVANVMMSVAEWEREEIGERTSDALQALKRSGVRLGRPVKTPPEVTAKMLRWRRRGWTWRKIAERLNADGVPTSQGGKCWRVNTVRGLAKSVRLDQEAERARRAS